MHLVDTNVLSELVRSRPSTAVLAWIERETSVAVSVVTVEELTFGVSRAPASRRVKLARWLESMLSTVEVLDVTAPIARFAGELRATRASTGRRVAQADTLICATALVHGLTLATRSVHDFAGCGVVIVDPFLP